MSVVTSNRSGGAKTPATRYVEYEGTWGVSISVPVWEGDQDDIWDVLDQMKPDERGMRYLGFEMLPGKFSVYMMRVGGYRKYVNWFGRAFEFKTCDQCGKEIRHHWRSAGPRCCSSGCYKRRRRKRLPAPPVIHRIHCEICDTPFEAKRSDAKFCGNKCRQAAHRAKKNPASGVQSR